MTTYPNWAAEGKRNNLFIMVYEAMQTYSSIFARTLSEIEDASDPIKDRFSISKDTQYGQTLVEKSQTLSSLSILDARELANNIAVHLANSAGFARAVNDYWRVQVSLLKCQHEAVLEGLPRAASLEGVFYVARAAELAERLGRILRLWEQSNSAQPRPVTRRSIPWSSSSSESSSNEDSDEDDNSKVLDDAAPVLPVRDRSPVRTFPITNPPV